MRSGRLISDTDSCGGGVTANYEWVRELFLDATEQRNYLALH